MRRQADLVDALKNISTERQNPDTLDIDLLDSLGVPKKKQKIKKLRLLSGNLNQDKVNTDLVKQC